MMAMTMSHTTKSTLSKMGLIFLTMAQPEIMREITQMMTTVLNYTSHPHPVTMTNPQDPKTQHKKSTKHKTQ